VRSLGQRHNSLANYGEPDPRCYVLPSEQTTGVSHARISETRSKEKLKKAYEEKLARALHAQRNGDLRTHSTLMEEAEELYRKLQSLES